MRCVVISDKTLKWDKEEGYVTLVGEDENGGEDEATLEDNSE